MPRSKLSTVSLGQLQQEIERRQKMLPKLIAQRDALNEEIADLQGLAEPSIQKYAKPKAASRKTGRRRAKNKISLVDALSQVMKGKPKVSVSEAMEGVLSAGYKTKSKAFRPLVNQTLLKNKKFKNVGRGEFRLKA